MQHTNSHQRNHRKYQRCWKKREKNRAARQICAFWYENVKIIQVFFCNLNTTRTSKKCCNIRSHRKTCATDASSIFNKWQMLWLNSSNFNFNYSIIYLKHWGPLNFNHNYNSISIWVFLSSAETLRTTALQLIFVLRHILSDGIIWHYLGNIPKSNVPMVSAMVHNKYTLGIQPKIVLNMKKGNKKRGKINTKHTTNKMRMLRQCETVKTARKPQLLLSRIHGTSTSIT